MNSSNPATMKRIAIIGAGVAGIGSIRAVKDEGMQPICFETSDKYGGIWNYREESVVGYSSIMSTTVLNHSKEVGAVSDFPPKKEYSNYMRHGELLSYITDYVKSHDIQKYIVFNTEVLHVKKAEDYDETGRFTVTVKNRISGKISTDIFDGVMVCTGHFNVPKTESFSGMETFKGDVMHTHSLKTAEKFKGKNVLVIGSGCSALDAAEITSSVAKQVYLSTRNGAYVIRRVGPNGYPIDHLLLRRYITLCLEYLPIDICSWYIETFYLDPQFDQNFYYIKPKYHVLSRDPILNDALFSKLLSGAVIQKAGVKCFTENGVVFDDEETVTEVDSVIMATGYKWEFPYLEDGLLETEAGRINLYKCMYPTQLPHSTLVFIAFVNPFGPGTPVAELQTRYAAQVFSGKLKLPPNDVMLKDAINRHEKNVLRYVPSDYMSIRIDVVSYCDDIASKLGVKPNLIKYLFTDFQLFLRLVFGPCVPYQYRLEGPNKWEGARDAIMTCDERIHFPLTKERRERRSIFHHIFKFIFSIIPKGLFIY